MFYRIKCDSRRLMNNKIKFQNKKSKTPVENILSSNPITQGDLVEKLNNLNNGVRFGKTSNREISAAEKSASMRIDYPELLKMLNSAVQKSTNANKLFSNVHESFVRKIGGMFSAIGFINEHSNCLNLRLLDKNSVVYSSRIFLNDSSNEIIKAIKMILLFRLIITHF